MQNILVELFSIDPSVGFVSFKTQLKMFSKQVKISKNLVSKMFSKPNMIHNGGQAYNNDVLFKLSVTALYII